MFHPSSLSIFKIIFLISSGTSVSLDTIFSAILHFKYRSIDLPLSHPNVIINSSSTFFKTVNNFPLSLCNKSFSFLPSSFLQAPKILISSIIDLISSSWRTSSYLSLRHSLSNSSSARMKSSGFMYPSISFSLL